MKVLTLGLGAFGFAINKLLGENNEKMDFYCFELNKEICDSVLEKREHPYFFNGYKLPNNVNLVNNFDEIIGDVDLLILAIPAQFINQSIKSIKHKLKSGITILNLAKGIDIQNNMTIFQIIKNELGDFNYNYAILSGGMIAQEVVERKKIGADLACTNFEICEIIKKLFANDYFKVIIRKEILNIELYGSLKNILAIIVGYHEGKGANASTIGYYINEFYNELKDIIEIYGGDRNIDFSYYSLGGDIIATCFGNSRNRYFGRLLGEGKKYNEVSEILKNENKHAEGVETLKAVYNKIRDRKGFEMVREFYGMIK